MFLCLQSNILTNSLMLLKKSCLKKPEAVIDYNNAKCFIGVSDQLSAYSTSVRRTIKWYRKISIELLVGASVVNTYCLYNKNKVKEERLSITPFKDNLCLKLLEINHLSLC